MRISKLVFILDLIPTSDKKYNSKRCDVRVGKILFQLRIVWKTSFFENTKFIQKQKKQFDLDSLLTAV